MRLLAIAGLTGVDVAALEGRDRTAVLALLAAHARHFLEGGGAPSLDDWAALTPLERQAFVAAGKALQVEQAVRIGEAGRGELAALRVRGELDDGRAHDEVLLEAAVRGLAESMRRSHEGANRG